jgi:hypothetical protein
LLVLLRRILARLLLRWVLAWLLRIGLLTRVLLLGWVLSGLLLVLLRRILARLLLRRVLTGLLLRHLLLAWLLRDYNGGLGLSFDDSDVLVVEEGSHHQVTTILASVDKMDALLNRASGSEHSKGHVGVSDGLASEQVLVANLNSHSLVELAELLDRDLHMLITPGGVFAAIDADV